MSQAISYLDSTHLAVGTGDNEDIDTVDLTLLKGGRVVVAPELGGGVEEDALGTVGDVLLVLARKHADDRSALVLLSDLVNDLGHVPVLVAGLDGAHGGLGGVVSGLDDIGLDTVGLGSEVDGLGVGDGVAVNLDTELDLDNVTVLEDNLSVCGEGRDVRDNVVHRDTGGESGAWVVLGSELGLSILERFCHLRIASNNREKNLTHPWGS
jgi:hypothetical protein